MKIKYNINNLKEYWTYFEKAPYGIFVVNNEGKYIDANSATSKITGYSRDELLNMTIAEIAAPEALVETVKQFNILRNEKKFSGEVLCRKKDNTRFVLSLEAVKSSENEYMAFCSDITHQKKVEKDLNDSVLKYKELAESITAVFYGMDKALKYTYWNKACEEFTGIPTEIALGKTPGELFPDIQDKQVENAYLKALETNEHQDFVTYFNKKGSNCYLEGRVYPTNEGLSVFVKDITENKILEEKLKRSEQEKGIILDNMQENVVLMDVEMRIIWLNKKAAGMIGSSPIKAAGNLCYDVWHHRRTNCDQCPAKRALKTGQFYEEIITSASGEIWLFKAYPVLKENGCVDGVVEVSIDITERTRIEEEYMNASKLEALGILAGGIAHDFNNILTIISGNISLARMLVNIDSKAYLKLNEVEKALNQAKELTKQLQTFARGGTPVREVASLKDLIKELVSFSVSGSNVDCIFSLPEDLWFSEIDVGQISQVFNNLIINAIQAMPEGGTIRVKGKNINVKEMVKDGLPLLKEGRYLKISVQDDGIGIPKENIKKIFHPFYSTKKEGNGLGLNTCYSIIRRHNGYIEVDSKFGFGTTFNIYLPASLGEGISNNQEEKQLHLGKGKILVMDDEKDIRETTGEMLSFLGYEVDFAKDGVEAIEEYIKAKELEEPFDVIVMDLTIRGGMGGKKAVEILKKIDPQIKAVISSGYSQEALSNLGDKGIIKFVNKPYKIEELSKVIYEVININDGNK